MLRTTQISSDRPLPDRAEHLEAGAAIASCLRIGLLLLTLAVVSVAPTGVWAQSLDDLRASGVIGERFDGYVVARDASAAEAAASINAKRRQIYEDRAETESATIDQVGRIYAQQIMQKAATGTWFLTEDGTWLQK